VGTRCTICNSILPSPFQSLIALPGIG
jgi:hypothetical protein